MRLTKPLSLPATWSLLCRILCLLEWINFTISEPFYLTLFQSIVYSFPPCNFSLKVCKSGLVQVRAISRLSETFHICSTVCKPQKERRCRDNVRGDVTSALTLATCLLSSLEVLAQQPVVAAQLWPIKSEMAVSAFLTFLGSQNTTYSPGGKLANQKVVQHAISCFFFFMQMHDTMTLPLFQR